jgi:serine protease Do
VNGLPVQDAGDLQELVAELGPNARADLEVYREGQRERVTVQLGEAPFSATAEKPAAHVEEGPEALLGMTVADLTNELASQFGITAPGGVVVTDVVPWSSAMRKGVVPGMKIDEVDHTPIRTARGFRQALGGLQQGHVVTMKLEAPDGTTRIVNLRAEVE